MPNKQKLSVEEKISLIWEYLNNRIRRSEAARRGGVARETISQWARNYEADGVLCPIVCYTLKGYAVWSDLCPPHRHT